MRAPELLMRNRISRAPIRVATDDTVLTTSADLGWSGITLAHQEVPAAETPEHFMAWHWLGVISRGRRRFADHDGRRWRSHQLSTRHLVLRPAEVTNQAGWPNPMSVIQVAVNPDVLTADTLGGSLELRSRINDDPVATAIVHALHAEARNGKPARSLVVDGLRAALSAHLVAAYGPGQRAPGSTRPLTANEISRVSEYMRAYLHEDLRLADLAALVPLSPAHFARAFRAATGTPPHTYLRQLRLDAAVTLLRRGAATVEEIAQASGYTDRGHLSRHTRAVYGLTPTQIRYGLAGDRLLEHRP